MTLRLPVFAASLVLAAGALWSLGFSRFVVDTSAAAAAPPRADGIVVLTGGAGRIEAAFRLLTDGQAPALLISGAGRTSGLTDLAKNAEPPPTRIDPASIGPRVTIGHQAASTLGNAAETEAWARRHAVHSLIVVTAGYHMPRALAEIAARLPDVALYPFPVQPPALRSASLRAAWDLATVRLLSGEYDKLLAVHFGLHHLWRKAPAP